MSIYALAAQSGMSALQLALTGSNAATKEAWNTSYNETAQRLAIASAKDAAQTNISALRQDKILSDVSIEIQQNEAEANAKVSAAVAGVSGTNVDQTVYMTEVNAAMAKQQNAQQTDQAVKDQQTAVENAELSLLSVPDTRTPSVLDGLLGAASAFEKEDFKRSKELSKQLDELWSK